MRSLHSVLLSACLSVCLPAADVSGVRGVQQVLDLFPTERGEEGTADSLKVTGVDHPWACADYVHRVLLLICHVDTLLCLFRWFWTPSLLDATMLGLQRH